MPYKKLRENRYQDLRLLGFVPFEARTLSRIPKSIPYMKEMAEKRYKESKAAKRQGMTEAKFQTKILLRYYAKGWAVSKRKLRTAGSVFAMLRTFEDSYRDRHPKYKSGSDIRYKDFSNFTSRYEAKKAHKDMLKGTRHAIKGNLPPGGDRWLDS
jgi:hypothetical protein